MHRLRALPAADTEADEADLTMDQLRAPAHSTGEAAERLVIIQTEVVPRV